ncbi:hypothetical protein V6N11_071671 [Hibiscus sabdariffa]|uniref:RRM domain-containing protein n=1 Tax=Hibiscus sabdariffa TaxID=183260 RepID=A0ABR2U1D8_9ROSI
MVGSSFALRKRRGFSAFVDNVSKRIHYSTLRKAFSVYGDILDVYVAYRNKRRSWYRSTFAFIRYRSIQGARLVIEKGDETIMNGFRVKVFLAKQKSATPEATCAGDGDRRASTRCWDIIRKN